jgi:L-threonylcarbamoyladenylate synthase
MDSHKNVAIAAALLRKGGIVAIPTETVYGLAANALDVVAVARVFEVKNRPFFDPLICHFGSVEAIKSLISGLSADHIHLLETLSPGPLTLLVPRPAEIPELVTSGSPWVAVRVPAHALTLELLQQLDFPLAAPSANPFGYLSPTRASHVKAQLGAKVDYILDGGPCQIGVESTVVELTPTQGFVLRPGGISLETLKEVLSHLAWQYATGEHGHPKSPGQLESHYAPHKPLLVVDAPDQAPDCKPEEALFIGFDKSSTLPYGQQVLLSPNGNLNEAAAAFFDTLHEAEAGPWQTLVAQTVPTEGLGRAINDRLHRAAAKRV